MPNSTVDLEKFIPKIPVQFKFDKIASAKDGFTSFNEVVLNENGLVAFTAGRNNSPGAVGVFTGNGKIVRTIADVRDYQFTNFGKIALNDAGKVTFAAGNENSSRITGIYRNHLRTNQTIADLAGLPQLFQDISPPAPTTYDFGGNLVLNNADTVVFDAAVQLGGIGGAINNKRLFLNQDRNNQKIAEGGDFGTSGFSQTVTFTDLQLNNLGQTLYTRNTNSQFGRTASGTTIVFEGKDIVSAGSAPGVPFREAVFSPVLNDAGSVFYGRSGTAFATRTEVDANNIYRFDTGASAPVRLSDQVLNVSSLTANDLGKVVFSGSTGNQSGLFLLDEGKITQISDRAEISARGGNFSNFLINNSNEIVFQLTAFEPNTTEIVARIGSTNRRVIGTGDFLSGSTVDQVQLRGLNNAGQIAFSVNFTDGKQGIFRANSTPGCGCNPFECAVNGAAQLPKDFVRNQGDFERAMNPTLPSSSLF